MSSDVSALRNVLRQRYGRDVSNLSELLRILELKKGTPWVQEYNRLVTWCNEQQEDLTWRTVLGHTAFLGLPIALHAFLESGMEAEMRDDLGRTPLHRIFQRQKIGRGHEEAVETLRSYGASIELSDNYGRTPASLARKNGHLGLLGATARVHESPSVAKARPSKSLELKNSLQLVTFDYDLFKGLLRGQQGMEYAALSYVWGQVQVFQTMKGNLDEVQERDAFRETTQGLKLPRTIHDAICLCQGLEIAYLWVDAICIVQDDLDSKKSQIHMMGSIYRNAYLTIIAAGGKDANSCLPLKFWRNIASEPNSYCLSATLGTLAETTVWAQRGWTFQEVVLSWRWIMFLPKKFIWTCPGGSWGDWCPVPKRGQAPHVSPAGGITDFSISAQSLSWWSDGSNSFRSACYIDYANQYNQRDLTDTRDGLSAFSGIIEYLEPALGTFIFGVPEMWFERGLRWQPKNSVSRRAAINLPTWSWVGWHGRLDRWHSTQRIVDSVQWWIHQDGQLRPLQSGLNTVLSGAFETIDVEYASKAQTKPQISEYGTLLHGRTQKAQVLAVYWSKDDTEQFGYGLGTYIAVLVILDDQSRACGVIKLHSKRDHDLPNHSMPVNLISLSKRQGSPTLHDLFVYESGLEKWGFNELHARILENSSTTHWFSDSREEKHYLDKSNYWFYDVMLVEEKDNVCYREGLGWIECDAWERIATEDVDVVLG